MLGVVGAEMRLDLLRLYRICGTICGSEIGGLVKGSHKVVLGIAIVVLICFASIIAWLSSMSRPIYRADHSALLATCRDMIDRRDSLQGRREGREVVIYRQQIGSQIPSVVRQLKPVRIILDKDRAVICVWPYPRIDDCADCRFCVALTGCKGVRYLNSIANLAMPFASSGPHWVSPKRHWPLALIPTLRVSRGLNEARKTLRLARLPASFQN